MINSIGKEVDQNEYELDVIKCFLQFDRHDIYGYNFNNFYTNYSDDESVRATVNEIIKNTELTCSINNISRILDILEINLTAGTIKL